MKEIKIKISDGVLSKINTLLSLKKMSGNTYGIIDEVVGRIMAAINDNKEELTLELKIEKKNGKE